MKLKNSFIVRTTLSKYYEYLGTWSEYSRIWIEFEWSRIRMVFELYLQNKIWITEVFKHSNTEKSISSLDTTQEKVDFQIQFK